MATRKGSKRPQGETRQSQIIGTFGPGSMTDLPKHAVLVGGLDFWFGQREEIQEPRLARKVAAALGRGSVTLEKPPVYEQDGPSTGIEVFQFPEWFVTENIKELQPDASVRTRYLVHRESLYRGSFNDPNNRKRKVVPIRFVRACRNGHIGDIDWYAFVHNGPSDCRQQGKLLFQDERGTSGDLTDLWVRCECGLDRSIAQASILKNQALGFCDGARPWLGPAMKERCSEPSRLLVRSASNAWFPQKISVISLPDRSERIKEALDAVWDDFEIAENLEDVQKEFRRSRVREAMEGFTAADVWAEIERRSGVAVGQEKSVKQAELEVLMGAEEVLGNNKPEGVFFARRLPPGVWNQPWMAGIERVVLVDRLREVLALVGFTRFEAAAPDIEGELDMGVRRAAIAREMNWVPAVENKGEGIFLQFSDAAISEWMNRPALQKRAVRLEAGFKEWRKEHPGSSREFPALPFLMLHSFSHLLLTAVALQCGYPASSLRERVYAVPGVGYGVLLYTGSSDAEGTLGGLVQVGRRIHESVYRALELGKLCSNDPICAQHEPQNRHESRFLSGAACHGCLLISETSCEQMNDFLDRALVVPTVDSPGAEFFRV